MRLAAAVVERDVELPRAAPRAELDVARAALLLLLVSIRVWRAVVQRQAEVDVAALPAGLPRLPRNPRGSWSTHLTRRRHCLRLLPRLLLQRRRQAERPAAVVVEVPALPADAVVQAAAGADRQVAVVPHLRLFPELGRRSPERPWSRGTPWPKRNAGTPMTAAQAITKAARSRLPVTSSSPG